MKYLVKFFVTILITFCAYAGALTIASTDKTESFRFNLDTTF